MIDIQFLRDIVRWAGKENDQLVAAEWDQCRWGAQVRNGVCQTACCLAGATALAAGYKFDFSDSDWYPQSDNYGNFVTDKMYRLTDTVVDGKGSQYYIPALATDLLGISPQEADRLFSGDNDYEAVVRIATGIAKDHGEILFPEEENA